MDLEKKKLQFKKNDEIVITIEDLGKDGEGIGHVDGYALFVKGALPGEKVLVHLMKLNKNNLDIIWKINKLYTFRF